MTLVMSAILLVPIAAECDYYVEASSGAAFSLWNKISIIPTCIRAGGNDAGLCNTKDTPCSTLQGAINKADQGSTICATGQSATITHHTTLTQNQCTQIEWTIVSITQTGASVWIDWMSIQVLWAAEQ